MKNYIILFIISVFEMDKIRNFLSLNEIIKSIISKFNDINNDA
jgi:hypothetical protein